MPIKSAKELDFSGEKISMLLFGRAGIGKTTIAESAPKPLLVDLENGIGRVEACYRKDVLTAERTLTDEEKYRSFIHDLSHEDLSAYETIIIDSVGKFMDLVTPVVIKENPANGQKDGKTLSQKGYGAIAVKFKELTKLVTSLGKHIIWIAHVTEVSDGDVVKVRINIPGGTKDKIWDDINLGGFMTFLGKDRIINFTPTEQYDAKGAHGVIGSYKIPELKRTQDGGKDEDNNFLENLFNVYINELNSANQKYSEDSMVYKEAMKIVSKINNISNIDELNNVLEEIRNTKHALTSKEELNSYFQVKVKELGAAYDKETKRYIFNA